MSTAFNISFNEYNNAYPDEYGDRYSMLFNEKQLSFLKNGKLFKVVKNPFVEYPVAYFDGEIVTSENYRRIAREQIKPIKLVFIMLKI